MATLERALGRTGRACPGFLGTFRVPMDASMDDADVLLVPLSGGFGGVAPPGALPSEVLAWVMILTSGMILNGYSWFAANCNWLWPSVALLALCILSEWALQGGLAVLSRRRLAGSAFLAFLCGMGNEYTLVAGGLWMAILGAASWRRGSMRADAGRFVVVILCLLAGGMMLVPGWLGRLENVARMGAHAEREEPASLILRCLFCLCWYMAKWALLLLVAGFVLGWRNLLIWTVRGRGMIVLAVGCLPFAWMTATPLWGMPRSLTTVQISLVCLTALWMSRAERQLATWKTGVLMGAAVVLCLSTLIPEGVSFWESKKIRAEVDRQLTMVEEDGEAVLRLQKPSPIAMPAWWPPLPRCLWLPAVGRLPWGISENMNAQHGEAVSRIYRVRSLRVITQKQSFDSQGASGEARR